MVGNPYFGKNSYFCDKYPNFYKVEQILLFIRKLHSYLARIVFGRAWHQMGQEDQYLAKNANFRLDLTVSGQKS